MKYVVFDYETSSRCDLRKRGAWVYSQDFSTFILCAGYKVVVDGKPSPTRVLSEAEYLKPDPALLALANDPSVIFMAHNCSFEMGMWRHHAVPAGYPDIPIERWHDTMATAAMKGLPLGLDALTTALELPVRKDMDGHRLMLQLCKPDRHDTWAHHTPENIARLKEYNVGDCDGQYASYVATGGLGRSERGTWIVDQKINQRGVKIDRDFVHACMDILEQVRIPMVARFKELTGGISPTQREKVLNWVNTQGVPLGDVKKATLDAILDPDDEFDIGDFDEPLPLNVHEVLSLRRSLASSSVAKLQRMLDCAGIDGRVRYSMQYHGARTGRWAGRLIQIQNYPRGDFGSDDHPEATPENIAEAILTRDVGAVKALWGNDIFSAVISSLRACIVPEKGHLLVAGDFAQVEARNLLSMSGQHDRAQMMYAGVDAYNEFGSMMFKRPFDRKGADKHLGTIPKAGVLSCGYGVGAVGVHHRMLPKEPLALAQQVVDTYRNDFAPMVPKFWYGLWEAATSAVWCSHAKTYEFQGVSFRREDDFLTMLLPSERKIWYHKPRKEKTIAPWDGQEKPSWSFMSYQGKKFRRHLAWHGLVTADCIQGLSRDLIVHAIKLSEKEGYPTVMTVHDEIVWEVPDNGTDYAKVQKQLMEDIPHWARERKLLVTAECDEMKRYRK